MMNGFLPACKSYLSGTKKSLTPGYLFPGFLLIGMLWSCGKPVTTDNDTPQDFCIPDSLMKNITLDTIQSEEVSSVLRLSGKITFNEDHVVKVFPLVSGHVSAVKVSLGDYVEKGQLLAVVRSTDMAGYFNDYKAAQSGLAVAKKNLEVAADMKNSGVSSEKEYLAAQSDYEKSLAQFNKMSEVMRIYGSSAQAGDTVGSGYPVKSPISGFIVEKNVTEGMELRGDDNTNLFTISDLKEVWATANVYEADISRIKPGEDVDVTTLSYPDQKFSGKVERISNVLNPETNVLSVKVKLSNPGFILKPGMFADISIQFPRNEKMLTVPSRTVLYDDNKCYVVRFRKRCDVDMVKINIDKTMNDQCFITGDSLHEGDLVIGRNGLFIFTALKKL